MSFRYKLFLTHIALVLISVVPLAAYIHYEVQEDLEMAIHDSEEEAFEARREQLRASMDIVCTMARGYVNRVLAGTVSDSEARSRFFRRIADIRYDGGNGYFWIHEYRPATGDSFARVIMYPIRPEAAGTPIDSYVDFGSVKEINVDGRLWPVDDATLATRGIRPTRFLADMNARLDSSGEAFVQYYWMKPRPDGSLTREGYLKLARGHLIPEWNWVIGSGIYLDDIAQTKREREALLRAHYRNVLLVAAALLGTVFFLTFLAALGISNRLTRPLRELVAYAHRVTAGDYSEEVTVSGSREIRGLQRAFQVMIAAIRLRETELRQRAEDLRVTDRAKSMILANVSHELKTPIASIRGHAELMLGGSFGPVTEMQREKLSVCMRKADSLVTLINELLSLSEAASRVKGPTALLDLRDLVTHAVESVEPKAGEERKVRIAAELPNDAVYVREERERIERVILNLLSNAIKFSRKDGRVIIGVGRSEDGRFAEMRVSDFGIGISPEDQERIFEGFYQVDGSLSRRYGGMGLGLAIVKVIVEDAGGKVFLTSEPGQGTTVTVKLPLAEDRLPDA